MDTPRGYRGIVWLILLMLSHILFPPPHAHNPHPSMSSHFTNLNNLHSATSHHPILPPPINSGPRPQTPEEPPPPPHPPPIRTKLSIYQGQKTKTTHPYGKLAPPSSSYKQRSTAVSIFPRQLRDRWPSYDQFQKTKWSKSPPIFAGCFSRQAPIPVRRLSSISLWRRKTHHSSPHKRLPLSTVYKKDRPPPHPNILSSVLCITVKIQSLTFHSSQALQGLAFVPIAQEDHQPLPSVKESQWPRQPGSSLPAQLPLIPAPMVTRLGMDRTAHASQIQEKQAAELALQQRMENERKKRQQEKILRKEKRRKEDKAFKKAKTDGRKNLIKIPITKSLSIPRRRSGRMKQRNGSLPLFRPLQSSRQEDPWFPRATTTRWTSMTKTRTSTRICLASCTVRRKARATR